jgi:hypothetical protein
MVKTPADIQHLVEGEVRRGHETPVDCLDLGDLVQARDGCQQVLAAQGGQVAAGIGVAAHRDGPAGEDDGDPRHGPDGTRPHGSGPTDYNPPSRPSYRREPHWIEHAAPHDRGRRPPQELR